MWLIVLVPISWPFLLAGAAVWLMVRFWRVSLPALAVLFGWWVLQQGASVAASWAVLLAAVGALVALIRWVLLAVERASAERR